MPKPRVASQQTVACLTLWVVSGAIQCAMAGERWHTGVLATSDYVHRGLSRSLGDPAIQGGATYRFESGVYAGVWASTVSNARTPIRGAAGRYEVNYLVGYARPWAGEWGLNLVLLRYEYPDSDAPVNYGYTELQVSIAYLDQLHFTAATSRDATMYTRTGGLEDRIATYAWELAGEQALGRRSSWFAGAGYIEFRDRAGTGYTYYSTGLAARLATLDMELQYVDTMRGERLFGRRLAGPRVVLSLLVNF